MDKYIIIFCTVPSDKVGTEIAENLVDKKLVACVNIIPGILSIYRWKENVCRDNELLLIMKSRESLFDKIKENILSIHPYEVPEIISVPIIQGNEPYLKWIGENTINL